jgi:peptidoglycan/LPS O-acetylase OafA/YrhL
VFLPSRRVDFAPAEVIGLAGNPIMLDFIAGMLLASAYRAKDAWLHSGARNAARAVGTMMIGVFAFCYLSPVRPGNGLLDKGLGALCLVAGSLLIELTLPGAKPPRRSKGIFAAFLWLGTISYTLYLVHQGISERLLRFLASLFFGVKVDGLPGFLSLILLSLALASGAHVFLERAFIWVGKRLTSPRGSHVRAAGLGA